MPRAAPRAPLPTCPTAASPRRALLYARARANACPRRATRRLQTTCHTAYHRAAEGHYPDAIALYTRAIEADPVSAAPPRLARSRRYAPLWTARGCVLRTSARTTQSESCTLVSARRARPTPHTRRAAADARARPPRPPPPSSSRRVPRHASAERQHLLQPVAVPHQDGDVRPRHRRRDHRRRARPQVRQGVLPDRLGVHGCVTTRRARRTHAQRERERGSILSARAHHRSLACVSPPAKHARCRVAQASANTAKRGRTTSARASSSQPTATRPFGSRNATRR